MAAVAEHSSAIEADPTTSEQKDTESVVAAEEQKESDDAPPIKPGVARNIKLYLVDPERFVIEWKTPKKMGYPLPLQYDIVINEHSFKSVLSQSDEPQNTKDHRWRALVTNCDIDELYKIGIDTLNDRMKGKQSAFQKIKTVLRPSVVTALTMSDGVIRWEPPLYGSYGNLCYELIDADDHEEQTILMVKEDEEYEIDINAFYENKGDDINLEDMRWRLRIKETHHGNHSFSPIITYNIGDIPCSKFTKYEVFDGDLESMNVPPLKYPKWEPPPKPDILDKIQFRKYIKFQDFSK